jgi:hypothetical protein
VALATGSTRCSTSANSSGRWRCHADRVADRHRVTPADQPGQQLDLVVIERSTASTTQRHAGRDRRHRLGQVRV